MTGVETGAGEKKRQPVNLEAYPADVKATVVTRALTVHCYMHCSLLLDNPACLVVKLYVEAQVINPLVV